MPNVFDIPKPLLEAIDVVMGLRRDLDIGVSDIEIGLTKQLTEVYHGNFENFKIPASDHTKVHDNLKILNPSKDIVAYTKDSSVLNKALWGHHVHDRDISEHADAIDSIQSSLLHRNDISGLKLYSGMIQSPISSTYGSWNTEKRLKTFHNPAFTSASTDINTAFRFSVTDNVTNHHESDHHGIVLPNARHLIEISFGSGNHVLGSTSSFSKVDRLEHEVLLDRGYMMNIHHRPTQIGHNPLNPVYLWHAVEPEINPLRKTIK